jgi:methyl-accepting chemotaxis protein
MLSSLRTRLILTSIAISTLSMTALALSSLWNVRNDTMQILDQQVGLLAQSYAENIAQWIDEKRIALEALEPHIQETNPAPFIKNIKQAGGFDDTYMGFPDKRFVALYELPGFDPTSRPWYKSAVEKKQFVVTAPYIDAVTGNLIVSFAKPVFDAGKTRELAVMAADMQLFNVMATLKKIKPTLSSYAFLYSNDGLIVTHPNREWELKPVTTLVKSLSLSGINDLASATGAHLVSIDDADQLLHVRRVVGTNWMLAVVVDFNEATAPLWRAIWLSVITSGIAILIASLLLSVGIRSMTSRLLTIRDAMKDIVSGEGDLTRRLSTIGRDELAQIAHAFNGFVDKIALILLDIRQAGESVKASSSNIASGNTELSARTEHQAGALEKTSTAMEELTAIVRQNADNARQANQLAVSASEVATNGGEVVGQVIQTMQYISASSYKIVEIISVIDGIAFQTNILALNAAVEAARAGEQGRGFAVVASEVRSLAQRSATAAKEIKDLIDESTGEVDAGSKLVKQAGDTMAEVVASVRGLTDIVGEISAANQEQSTGIVEIGRSITEMDQMTQQNAILVQSAAAAAQSLQEQATGLAKTIGVFKLDTDAAPGNVTPVNVAEGKIEASNTTQERIKTTARSESDVKPLRPKLSPKHPQQKTPPSPEDDMEVF